MKSMHSSAGEEGGEVNAENQGQFWFQNHE